MQANRKALYIRARAIHGIGSYPDKANAAMTQPQKTQAAINAISKRASP